MIYCCSVWGNSHKNKMDKLVVIQNKIIRAMTYSGRMESAGPLLRRNNLLPLRCVVEYFTCIYVYKCLEWDNNMFHFYHPNIYNTRLSNSRSLIVPNIMSSHSRMSVLWSGCQLWNGLPGNLRELPTCSSFKRQLKTLLLSQ